MASTVRGVIGLTVLLSVSVGCDAGDDTNGLMSTGSGGAGSGGAGSGGSAMLPPGVPLTPTDGWVAVDSNELGVQGAIFAYGDDTSKAGPPAMTENFMGTNACITGTAARVDMACTPVAPATDCYGTYWGAAIGLNMNQPIDPGTMMGVDPPLAFDGSALTGFAFEITGAGVPTSLRFKVESPGAIEYCTPPATKMITTGANTVLFSDLRTECWTTGGNPGDMGKASIQKIAWQVVTNDKATVPFDFCVSNIRALK